MNFEEKRKMNNLTLEEKPTISGLLESLSTSESSGEVLQNARKLGSLIEKQGLAALQTERIFVKLQEMANNKKSGLEREGGALGFAGIVEVLGRAVVPSMLPLLAFLLDMSADKGAPVREAAYLAVENVTKNVDEFGIAALLPFLLQGTSGKWQAKIVALQFLSGLAKRFSYRFKHTC